MFSAASVTAFRKVVESWSRKGVAFNKPETHAAYSRSVSAQHSMQVKRALLRQHCAMCPDWRRCENELEATGDVTTDAVFCPFKDALKKLAQ